MVKSNCVRMKPTCICFYSSWKRRNVCLNTTKCAGALCPQDKSYKNLRTQQSSWHAWLHYNLYLITDQVDVLLIQFEFLDMYLSKKPAWNHCAF